MVTDAQVRLLRQKRMDGKTLEAAAAAAGMSLRSASTWQSGPLPSQARTTRHWRTRPDPFAEVWDDEVVPLLQRDERGELEAKTILEQLCAKDPARFAPGQVRTLQRRVREWRAAYGPHKEVFFPQQQEPGWMAAFDFTSGTELGVTIAGVAFAHLWFHFVLAWSHWHFVQLAFSETFEALLAGLQGALWSLGGVPRVLRLDNLSAATHELARTGGRALTKRFKDVVDHYDVRARPIEPGKPEQNGVAEKGHHLFKSALTKALIVRGSRDFARVADYEAFVQGVVQRMHRGHETRHAEERAALRPLPRTRLPEYTELLVKVRCWSTIELGGRIYSVPSRLIGHTVVARLRPNEIELRFAGKVVETMPRMRGTQVHRIDYRHVIWSLVRKPGAFAHYRYREELFPSLVFRRAYDALVRARGERADVEYVRLLHLAASTGEAAVERTLSELLDGGESFDYARVKAHAQPQMPEVPTLQASEVNLRDYDVLLSAGGAR